MNALMASDSVLLPCDMSMLAVDGVVALLETVEELDQNLGHALSILGILKTRVDRRNQSLNRQVESALNAAFSHLVLTNDIPVNSALAKAQADGVSIFEYEPGSRGALSYRALGEEVLGRIGRSNAVFSRKQHLAGEKLR